MNQSLNRAPQPAAEPDSPELLRLNAAILHANEVADKAGDTECGHQHRQLAAWLVELRELRPKVSDDPVLPYTVWASKTGPDDENYSPAYIDNAATLEDALQLYFKWCVDYPFQGLEYRDTTGEVFSLSPTCLHLGPGITTQG